MGDHSAEFGNEEVSEGSRGNEQRPSRTETKLELEITKLRNDADAQATDRPLGLEKTNLELEKLRQEALFRGEEAALRLLKLKLESTELSRSPWSRPGTVIPLVATIATLAFSQWLGVFDVAKKELDVRNREIKIDNENLTRRREVLAADLAKLAQEKVDMEKARAALLASNAALQKKIDLTVKQHDEAKRQVGLLTNELKVAQPALVSMVSDRLSSALAIGCTARNLQSGPVLRLDEVYEANWLSCVDRAHEALKPDIASLPLSDQKRLEQAIQAIKGRLQALVDATRPLHGNINASWEGMEQPVAADLQWAVRFATSGRPMPSGETTNIFHPAAKASDEYKRLVLGHAIDLLVNRYAGLARNPPK